MKMTIPQLKRFVIEIAVTRKLLKPKGWEKQLFHKVFKLALRHSSAVPITQAIGCISEVRLMEEKFKV